MNAGLTRAEISTAAISLVDRQTLDRQRSLRALVAVNELIWDRLRVIGIDPALAETLRRGEAAAAELAAIPETLDLKTANEAILRFGINQCGRRGAKSGRKLGR